MRWMMVLTLTMMPAVLSAAETPEVLEIPVGSFIAGSDRAEREAAYRLDETAYGHRATREGGWYENEGDRRTETLPTFRILAHPVTNAEYARFVAATGHAAPDVDEATWNAYGLIHPYARTQRHAWTDGRPPEGRDNHPVVLVSHADAEAYARWLTVETGRTWRLPTQLEWQKAARGLDGRRFPWGDTFDPDKLNSHDRGPFDTTPVDAHPQGRSPFGLWDAAGNVFEWTRSPPEAERAWVVGGGSWDDMGCGVCRPAARHSRPKGLKHILIGFRLVSEDL